MTQTGEWAALISEDALADVRSLRLIVSHDGKSDRDQVLAVAFLLAVNRNLVWERREPKSYEFSDPTVAIIDVGKRYEPKLWNLDHHGMDLTRTPGAAFVMVLDRMGILPQARRLTTWLETVSDHDLYGPALMAARMGISDRDYLFLQSPFDLVLSGMFSNRKSVAPQSWEHAMLQTIGTYLLAQVIKASYAFRSFDAYNRSMAVSWLNGIETVVDLFEAESTRRTLVKLWMYRVERREAVCGWLDEDGHPVLSVVHNDAAVDFRLATAISGVRHVSKDGRQMSFEATSAYRQLRFRAACAVALGCGHPSKSVDDVRYAIA